jgi:hypothetical protein
VFADLSAVALAKADLPTVARTTRSIGMKRALKIVTILGWVSLLGGGLAWFFLFGKTSGHTRWSTAWYEMGEIRKALIERRLYDNRYPESLDALKDGHFPNGVPKNPFTRKPYDYVTNGDRFFLVCYGHDNKAGGAEPPDTDIVYSELGRLSR